MGYAVGIPHLKTLPTKENKMEIILCAVLDKKAKEFQAPFAQPNKAVACRSFMQAVNEDKSVLNKFAEDYALYMIGKFNVEKGTLKQENELLLEAANVATKKN